MCKPAKIFTASVFSVTFGHLVKLRRDFCVCLLSYYWLVCSLGYSTLYCKSFSHWRMFVALQVLIKGPNVTDWTFDLNRELSCSGFLTFCSWSEQSSRRFIVEMHNVAAFIQYCQVSGHSSSCYSALWHSSSVYFIISFFIRVNKSHEKTRTSVLIHLSKLSVVCLLLLKIKTCKNSLQFVLSVSHVLKWVILVCFSKQNRWNSAFVL